MLWNLKTILVVRKRELGRGGGGWKAWPGAELCHELGVRNSPRLGEDLEVGDTEE